MENRPAIVLLLRTGEDGETLQTVSHHEIVERYTTALERAGAEVRAIHIQDDERKASEAVRGVAGMVLMGGGDVHPFWYHEHPSELLRAVDVSRDEWEIACVHAAIARGIPCLGICRGMQLLNVALGGSLIQDLGEAGRHETEDQAPKSISITCDPEGMLFRGGSHPVIDATCQHHQAIKVLGEGLAVVARSEDGVIEAVERRSGSWIGGVQWHPERTAAEQPEQQALFNQFVRLCSTQLLQL
ncbi:MAG: gamma-glutamyl-gamma-aminobutyrate hydrolase family protein [Candidatus Dormibacteria bacterium]